MRSVRLVLWLAAVALAVAAVAVASAKSERFPTVIPLPDGFRPEGIESGYGTEFFVGSLANGAIYRGDFRTGEGDILVPGVAGRVSAGLGFDKRSGYLFVAGGQTGNAYVYDTRTGEDLGVFPLTGPGNFINDAVVTREAAYFTSSFQAVLYKIPTGAGGALPDPSAVEVLPLSGDWTQVPGFNANGIDATQNGKTLIVVNSTTGRLYRVDADTGVADEIDLGGATVTSGDGILLDGKTLYVVRNFLNKIAVVRLTPDLSAGEVTGEITSPHFRVPTTVTEFGNALYAVNARFDTPPGPDVEYEVVRVLKR